MEGAGSTERLAFGESCRNQTARRPSGEVYRHVDVASSEVRSQSGRPLSAMADPFFITTAIDYTNAPPHIGHAYEKILADVLARYHRLKGEDVYFLTGVDQHGQKVQQAAAKEGVAPQDFVDRLSVKFTDLWQKLELSYDGWAATTDPNHKRCVQDILQALK